MSITNPAPSIKKIKIKVLAQFTGQEQMVVEYVHSFFHSRWNFPFLSQQNKVAFFYTVGIVIQQASKWLLSAFRHRRQRWK